MNADVGEWAAAVRHDPSLVILDGFHALKHGLRFGAEVLDAVTWSVPASLELASRLAPDLVATMARLLTEVPRERIRREFPRCDTTGVVALARRREGDADRLLKWARSAPLVVLERPRHAGNVGAAVRVAAAAGASGVLTTGDLDPWQPAVLRGSAGLHFAVPVASISALPADLRGPVVAVDPDGGPVNEVDLPGGGVLIFGSERWGLAGETLSRADIVVSIPMAPGVASLNLATAVAVVLYRWRLRAPIEDR